MSHGFPFVNLYDYWSLPIVPKTFASANAMGRAYGLMIVQDLKSNQFTPLLGHVIRSMVHKGSFGGVEVGFCQEIASAVAMAAPTPAPSALHPETAMLLSRLTRE